MSKKNKPEFHWPILGHSLIKQYLQTAVSAKNPAHAYLFHGPPNVGKMLMAGCFAASLLCRETNSHIPCTKCQTCRHFASGTHPDAVLIRCQADKKNIGIGQIRELQRKLSLTSFLTSYKIAIIDEAELMTEEAANALLKTLEEPTPMVVFILISSRADALPATIVSRCQSIVFNLIPVFQIENWLIKSGLDKRQAKIFSSFSAGRPGLSITLAESGSTIMADRNENIKILLEIIKGGVNDRLQAIQPLLPAKNDKQMPLALRIALLDWLSFFRDVLLIKYKFNDIVNQLFVAKITRLASNYQLKKIKSNIEQITNSIEYLKKSVNPRLVLENLALSII